MASELDAFVGQLGNPGRYQIFVCCILIANTFPSAFNSLNMIFIGSTPPHHCKVTANSQLNESVPLQKNSVKAEQCLMYVDESNHSEGKMGCNNGWEYEYKGEEWGIVGEWNLVCDRKHLVGLATTLYFAGTLVTTPVIGALSDRVGRKWLVVGLLLCHVVVGVSQSFASSFAMFICLRILQGAVVEGACLSGYTLRIELLQTHHRTSASIASGYVWCLAQFVLVAIAYLFPDWRSFYLATTLPSLVVITYIWLLPESIRWLLVKRKVKEATVLAKKIAKINGISLKDNNLEDEVAALAENLQRKETISGAAGLQDLFRTKGVRKTTLIAFYIWFCMPLIYFGINFALPTLDGNKYINFMISASLELLTSFIYHAVMKNFGRRMPSCIFFILAGFLCIGSVVAKFAFDDGVHWSVLSVGCALIGKAVSNLGWGCSDLLLIELFPTVLRGASLGLGTVVGTIGAMVAPQIILLGEYCSTLVPLVTFGVSSIVAGGLVLFLPETRYVTIPDTIEEAELLHSMCANGTVPFFAARSASGSDSAIDTSLQDEDGILGEYTFALETRNVDF